MKIKFFQARPQPGALPLGPRQGLPPLEPCSQGRCPLGTPVEYGLRPYTSNNNNSNKRALPHLLTCLMCIIIRFDHQVNPRLH
ncbi:hypothetical protein HanIR_Chr01g0045761 [Helianthus annuus]|nr:hypothetical protein HanIR_Chr01g0045761 [Helianthus annuus]